LWVISIPKGWVDTYLLIAGFVHPRDGKIHWTNSVRLHP
jgi:hypothetical protein